MSFSNFVLLEHLPLVHATTLFSDGFESGQINPSPGAWTGNGSSTATITVSTDCAHSGTYSAKLAGLTSNGRNAYATINVAGNPTILYARSYVNFTSDIASGTQFIGFPQFVTANYGFYSGLQKNATGDYWVAGRYISSYAYWNSSIITLSTKHFYQIGMKVVISATVGELHVYVDGVEVVTVTGIDTGINPITSVRFGGIDRGAVNAGTIYIDDAIVATTNIDLDTTPPTFGSIAATNTLAGASTTLSCSVSDDNAVSFNYIATNNTGSWTGTNQTAQSGGSASLILTWNATVGNVVGVQVWANDTSNNNAYSSITYFTLTASSGWTRGISTVPNNRISSIGGVPLSKIHSVGGVP